MNQIEENTKFVFGESFKRYSKQEIDVFINFLEVRLQKNNISKDIFKDKICLDAGCGNGRGSILMAKSGAKKVVSYDLSEQNIETVNRLKKEYNLDNIQTFQGSVLDIPFKDEYFDFVWCNGVLHHTKNPTKGLWEITRVLKEDCYMWLYLYGAGGIYWYVIDFIREYLKDISQEEVLNTLVELEYTSDKIAEFMDDWKVPVLEKYTIKNIEQVLMEKGLTFRKLNDGVNYDTSKRRLAFDEKEIMGDGDLRYLCKREYCLVEVNELIDNKEYSDKVKMDFSSWDKLKTNEMKILLCAELQIDLRNRMSLSEKFNINEFRREWESK